MDQHVTKLVWNSFAKIGAFPNRRQPQRFVVCAPSRRRGLLKHVVDRGNPRSWAALENLYESSEGAVPASGILEEMGLLLPEEDVPQHRPVFACWLDEVGAHDTLPADELELNPELHLDEAARSKPTASVELEHTFEWGTPDDWFLPAPRVWVRDAQMGATWAYGVRGDDLQALKQLRTGALATTLPEAQVRRFYAAGVFVSKKSGSSDPGGCSAPAVEGAAHSLQRDGHAVLPRVFPLAQGTGLARYVHELIANGFVKFGDSQVSHRFAAHNEGVSRYLQQQLTAFASRVFGLGLKPSYCYLVSYAPGAELRRHVDRAESAYSLNVLLEAFPLVDGRSAWPLFIETSSGEDAALYQAPGEIVVYEGAKFHHYRPALPDGFRSVSLFLQYVPVDHAGSLL